MPLCRICGESKDPEEFYNVTTFCKYKKHPVVWCRDCQKMWLEYRKEQERLKKILAAEKKFTVSFE